MYQRSVNASNGCVDIAIDYAFAQEGKPYSDLPCYNRTGECCRFGPNCFDSAGLIYVAYRQARQKVPPTHQGYPGGLKSVGVGNAKPGDILWRSGHVGLLGKNDKVVHLSNPNRGVYILSLSNFKQFLQTHI
ncbi:hypothetical protein BLNAU_20849 [Blattamonas nauphoetae]|uniref:NlpC/P60 domain-containing protein n=1 Tax=Blattamonas nauphoetae TaxID=2049346 RepID=A0ABQ9WXK1_9EUKA|nr:hypothetical protein BLNAU_20849 [Blattamonas nauphoetae]